MFSHNVRGESWWCGGRYLTYLSVTEMSAEGQSDRRTSDVEVLMKQRCVTEFCHEEKMTTIGNVDAC